MLSLSSPRQTVLPTAIVAAELAAIFIGATLPTPLYPIYREEFGFGEVTLTLIYAVYVLGNVGALIGALAGLALATGAKYAPRG
jgi:hypothetical protein